MKYILRDTINHFFLSTRQLEMEYRGIYNHVPDPVANMNILVNWKDPLAKIKVSNYRTNKWTDIIFDINTTDKDLVVQAAKGLDQNMRSVQARISRNISKDITTFTLSSAGSVGSKENEFIEVNIDKLWSGGRNSEEELSDGWEKIINDLYPFKDGNRYL
jgi:hypothetical protein